MENSDAFLLYTTLVEYQFALTDIELFGITYPENKEGYNYLIRIAKRYRERLSILGCSTILDELPLDKK
jgi:hypothetical protein